MNSTLEEPRFIDVPNIKKKNAEVKTLTWDMDFSTVVGKTLTWKKKENNNCNIIHTEKQYFLMYTAPPACWYTRAYNATPTIFWRTRITSVQNMRT